MDYNKEESDRQAVSLKQQEKMIDSIKASIRDVILEQQRVSDQDADKTLQSLAKDTPYKRVRKQVHVEDSNDTDIVSLMQELRELTKSISKRDNVKCSHIANNVIEDMDTEAAQPSAIDETPQVQQSNTVTVKQQAGYTPSSQRQSTSTLDPLSEFITAVVTKN